MSVIELQAVRKQHGEVAALAGVDLRVERGEVVALLGPNGAGKTTTFELLLGLASPTSGQVRVLGAAPGGAVRERLGAMLQGAGLPEHVTVAELVRLVGRSYPAALPVDEVLARTGLAERRRRRIADLSGGERQRVLLAMATVAAPELLLLDEPTAAMDVDARRAFWDLAQASVRGGATILFATHDLAEADAVAERIVILQAGRVVADAAPAQLKARLPGVEVRVATDAPLEILRALPAVRAVELDPQGSASSSELRRLLLRAEDAEGVVVPLVSAGYRVSDLEVSPAALEDAFRQLTHQPPPAVESVAARPPVTTTPEGAER